MKRLAAKTEKKGTVTGTVKKTKKIPWDLLPLIMALAVLPLVAMGRKVSVTLGKYSWFADGNFQYDFFMYAKSIVFLVLVIWMLVVLFDRVLIRGIRLKHWKLFIPLYIYGLLIILSTVFSADRDLSLKGMWQQYESVWVLLGYLMTVFYCVQVVQSLKDIRILCVAMAVGAAVQGLIGLTQFVGKDFFSSGIGKAFLTLGMDSSVQGTLRFTYEENSRSSVYMASYTPNYAGMYLVLILPLLCVMTVRSKKMAGKISGIILIAVMLVCLYGSGSKAGFLVCGFLALLATVFMTQKDNVKKRWISVGICFLAVTGISFGYDQLSNHALSNALTKTGQKQSYNLEEINTEADGVSLKYKGNSLKLIPEKTEMGQTLKAQVNEGKMQDAFWDDENQCFIFKDERFGDLTFDAYRYNNAQYLAIYDGEMTWDFYKEDSASGYVFMNQYGKIDEINNAPAVLKGYERILSGRGYIWGRTIPLLSGTVLWGSGPDTFIMKFPQTDYVMKANTALSMYQQLPTKAHSMYLQSALQTGVISVICLLIFFLHYMVTVLRNRNTETNKEKSIFRTGILLSVIGFLIMGLTNDSNLAVSPMFWCILGMGIAMETETFHS